MYKPEFIKKVYNILISLIAYFESIFDSVNLHVTISKGNKKIGNTLNVSLAPIVSCPNCSGCCKYCYDLKAVNQYKNVANARAKNWVILQKAPERYFADIRKALKSRKKNKYFRWHVSGDITSMYYFEQMVEIAKEYPDFTFWTYTKNYIVVNQYCKNNGNTRDCIPVNLSIMFSEWRGMPMINPFKFPEFKVVFKDEEKPEGKYCPGNCDICIKAHSHCVKGETVYCNEH